MKDPDINPLNKGQRKLLQLGVVLLLAIFLIIYFFILQRKTSNTVTVNNSVTLEGTKLQVFNDSYTFNGYPDKILIHYPYFLLVQGEKPLTIIYNLETKKKEKEIKENLLDYYQGNIVYNKKTSYYNNVNLDKYCDAAFIKSDKEILCTFRSNQDSVNNKLVSIRPDRPDLWGTVYTPSMNNILTTISNINNNLYLGEINYETKKNYVTINKQTKPVDNIVSLIYPMKNQPYFASFPSVLNNQKTAYYIINYKNINKISDSINLYKK